jgi:hypothetical protein
MCRHRQPEEWCACHAATWLAGCSYRITPPISSPCQLPQVVSQQQPLLIPMSLPLPTQPLSNHTQNPSP